MTTTATYGHAHAEHAPAHAKDGCGCGCSGGHDPCMPGGVTGLERTRWFPRMLVGPEDLTQDQRFFRDALRRHNRLLHGYGVVCGLRVRRGEGSCELIVESGYALGPWGDEIVVPEDVTIDACVEDADGNALGPCGAADPWCAPVRVAREPRRPLYLAIRYDECDTRPVRVVGGACGCEETACEYSRTRMSYAIKLLTELPESHAATEPPDIEDMLFDCTSPPACPPCPEDPWIVLADILVVGDTVEDIDCATHRRHVISWAPFWYRCGSPKQTPGRDATRAVPVLVEEQPRGTVVLAEGQDEEPGGTPMFPEGQPLAGRSVPPPGTETLVTARRANGDWVVLPLTLAIEEGDTIADAVARNARTFSDPESGERFELAEIVAAAGLDASEPAVSARRLASRLEQVELGRVRDLRVAATRLDDLLDESGTEALGAVAAPDRAVELPATALAGVAPDSTLGKRLAGKSIGDLAAMDESELERLATSRVPAAKRAEVLGQARPLLDAAVSVKRLAEAWRGGGGG